MAKVKAKVLSLDELVKGGEGVPDEVREALLEAVKESVDGVDSEEARKVIEEVLGKRDGHTKFGSLNEAHAQVLEYVQVAMPKAGDLVERNEYGMARYRMPDHAKNESAVVLAAFDTYRTDHENEPVNGIIGVSDRKGIVRTYSVDLRRYKAVAMKDVN